MVQVVVIDWLTSYHLPLVGLFLANEYLIKKPILASNHIVISLE